jgi:hypothetical protein
MLLFPTMIPISQHMDSIKYALPPLPVQWLLSGRRPLSRRGYVTLCYVSSRWHPSAARPGSARPKNSNNAYLSTHQGAGGKWKGYPVNVGRGAPRGRGDPSRGGSVPRGNPRFLPYYKRNWNKKSFFLTKFPGFSTKNLRVAHFIPVYFFLSGYRSQSYH